VISHPGPAETRAIALYSVLPDGRAGYPSKNIAADLGISQRTVDNHRAAIMRKTGSKSIPALVPTALAVT
jgi:FixJ family two-component response regulator